MVRIIDSPGFAVESLLLLLQRPIARNFGALAFTASSPTAVAIIVLLHFLVGIYGRYSSAEIWIPMLSSLAFMGLPDIHQMNAISILIFIFSCAIVMGLAGTLGGYADARVARRMKPDDLRALVVFVGFAIRFTPGVARRFALEHSIIEPFPHYTSTPSCLFERNAATSSSSARNADNARN